ncbi:hypothetical protein CAEBREN_24669 [Caenorhabditis brenneri]|uniref:Uncharacterized protein n=1 Tax=Caenorhabditis brenneri TaxID=135651 RepID=G0MHB7_CAEBE|nr:hypothetical protein CAEBREN_24669 [Caenorhabditis brenneri]
MADENSPPSSPPPLKARTGFSNKTAPDDSFHQHSGPDISPILPSSTSNGRNVETPHVSDFPMSGRRCPTPDKSHGFRRDIELSFDMSPIFPSGDQKEVVFSGQSASDTTLQKGHQQYEWMSPVETKLFPPAQPDYSMSHHRNRTSGYRPEAYPAVSQYPNSENLKKKSAFKQPQEKAGHWQPPMKDVSMHEERVNSAIQKEKKADVKPQPGLHSFDNSEKLPCLPPIKPVVTSDEEKRRLDVLGRHQTLSPIRFHPKPTDRSPMPADQKRLMSALLGKDKDLENISHLGKFVPMDPLTSQGSPYSRSTLPTKYAEGITPRLKTAERTEPTSITERSPGEDTLLFHGIRPPGFYHKSSSPSAVRETSSSSQRSVPQHLNIHQYKSVSENMPLHQQSISSRASGKKSDLMKATGSTNEKMHGLNRTAEFSWEGKHTPFVYDLKGDLSKVASHQCTRGPRSDQPRDRHSRDISLPLYKFESQDFGSESRFSPLYSFDSEEVHTDNQSSPFSNSDLGKHPSNASSGPLYKFDSVDVFGNSMSNQSTEHQDYTPQNPYSGTSSAYLNYKSSSQSTPNYPSSSVVDSNYPRYMGIPADPPVKKFYQQLLKISPPLTSQHRRLEEDKKARRQVAEPLPPAEPKPSDGLDLTAAEIEQVTSLPTHQIDGLFTLYVQEAIRRRGLGGLNANAPTSLAKSLDEYWYRYQRTCILASKCFDLQKRARGYFMDRERFWKQKLQADGAPVNWIVRHYYLCRKNIDVEPTVVSDAIYLKTLPHTQFRSTEMAYLKFIYVMQH